MKLTGPIVVILALVILVVSAGCIGGDGGEPPAEPDGSCDGPPGLYVDGACTTLAEGVRPFRPRYVLWSDGAEKERFVWLPPGTTIDTSAPSDWVFPIGTRLYKMFSRDGRRIETRMLEKVTDGAGVDAWTMRVFAWNETGDAATEVVDGVQNALGTTHDIPPASLCRQCHSGVSDGAIGFSALQLAHDDVPSGVTLRTLIDEKLLSAPIDPDAAEIPVEHDDGSAAPDPETTRRALGYVHANCGHCHNRTSPPMGMTLQSEVGLTSLEQTGVFRTAVSHTSYWTGGGAAHARIDPGHPESSAIVLRMSRRGEGEQMPPIATETIDADGIEALTAFVRAL